MAFILPLTFTALNARGDVNILLGRKNLRDEAMEPLGHQGEFGVEMSFGGEKWPVMIAVDIMISANAKTSEASYHYYDYYYGYAYTQDIVAGAATVELDLGVRKTWKFDKVPIRPYVGGGLGIMSGAFVITDEDGNSIDDANDAALGYWAGGGVFFRLGRKFNLGVSLRYSKAEVDLSGGLNCRLSGDVCERNTKVDVGGIHTGLLVGFGW